jgi:Phage gp6-like head-tail connector protein
MSDRAWIILNPVSVEPITLIDIKNYLRIDFADDDAVINGLITRARGIAERISGRAFATQTIQEVFTIIRPPGGEVSGPLTHGPNWYQYQEQIGANPFGAAQFYFDLAMPPIQANQPILVETKVTAFEPWTLFTGVTYVDPVQEPCRMYFQSPITANFWRFTFTCGYNPSYTLHGVAPDLEQALYEAVAFLYDHREADDFPMELKSKFLARRDANAWI